MSLIHNPAIMKLSYAPLLILLTPLASAQETRGVEDVFSPGFILEDRNQDGVIDFVNAELQLGDSTSAAVVAADAQLGPDVTIGPCAVIESQVIIGPRTRVLAGATVGARARIGASSILHPGVTIYPDCVVGDRVIIHSGVVIGSDGFGYATEDGVHLKIPHLGRVVIEDDVEIGANTTIDRGTLGETRIGRGTKIDNLVQVAHNVSIGEGAILVAQVGVGGSATIGPGAMLAGQSGVVDHQAVGARAIVLGRSGVTKDVPPGAMVSGFPARDHHEELRVQAAVRRLSDLIARVEALEARLASRQRGSRRTRS